MKKLVKFGEDVDGFDIPVLNEREIRASAGILFLAISTALVLIIAKGDFLLTKYVVSIFLVDFIIRVFVNPKFSPSMIIGRLIVRNQVPEYVGAKQKKFAWIIGVILSSIMFTYLVVFNAYGPITGIGCLLCLIFLFFETAFGICLGCKVYSLLNKEEIQYCPGEVCDSRSKQDIQKTSGVQLLVILILIVIIFLAAFFFNDSFSKQPRDLFGARSFVK